MSQNKTPERIDLNDLAVGQRNPALRALLRRASRYQAHLEEENRRLTSELEEAGAGDATVPRVIDPEDIQVGQLIFVTWETGWHLGRVHEGPGGLEVLAAEGRRTGDDQATYVLLEDAPAEKPEPVKVGDQLSTVKELEILKRGTVLRDGGSDIWLHHGGDFWISGWSERNWTPGDIAQFAPFTVLYLPEECS